ncbi:MAG: hypothetical protein K9N09_08180 [Candidatus Cloacimonetes bacterium]|nr:hypothetical protein [Candidatus Cloacimonadota bacterium]MCF7868662.1 hypothetical protein [Candidatus Cloacimonadota bacterium]
MKIVLNWGIKTSFYRFLKSMLMFTDIVQGKKIKTICFYPDKPITYDIMYWIAFLNRYRISDKPENTDILMYWKDSTFHESEKKLINHSKWINIDCTDISKETISANFKNVFGYDLIINPLKYKGYCVQKNNLNAKHDGKIIKCPVSHPEPDFIYQKLINNKVNDNMIVDIRVPIFKDIIPFVYLKYRNIQTRFLNTNDSAEIKKTTEILSKQEIERIIEFSRLLNMDYGELDVLRDNNDKKIYIVDANHCPSGPPNHLPYWEKFKSLKSLANCFEKQFG